MTTDQSHLNAARAALAEAMDHAAATAANLERVRASEAAADIELDRWRTDQVGRESSHEARVVAAIAAGASPPPYFHDVNLVAERERLEAQKRAMGQAREQFERDHAGALETVKVAKTGVQAAATQALRGEAVELASRRRALKAELKEIDNQLRGFEAVGGRLPLEVQNINKSNWLHYSASALNEAFEQNLLDGTGKLPAAYVDDWKSRHAALIAGTELDSAASSQVAA